MCVEGSVVLNRKDMMLYFFRRNIFDIRRMLAVDYDLTRVEEEKQQPRMTLDGHAIEVRRVEVLLEREAAQIRNAIKKMDFKPTFDIEEIRRRLARGFYFVVVKHQDRIIGWYWAGVKEVYFEELNCHIKIKRDQAFLYNMYIEKKHRGRGIIDIARRELFLHLKKEKYKRAWSLVKINNKASLKSHTRMNYRFLGNYIFVRLLSFTLTFSPKSIR